MSSHEVLHACAVAQRRPKRLLAKLAKASLALGFSRGSFGGRGFKLRAWGEGGGQFVLGMCRFLFRILSFSRTSRTSCRSSMPLRSVSCQDLFRHFAGLSWGGAM